MADLADSKDEVANIGSAEVINAETPSRDEYAASYLAQPWYKKPIMQIILVSFVCFTCPGMFNALNGLGGGGNQNAKTADKSSQIVGSIITGFFLDSGLKRHFRAYGGWVLLVVLVFAVFVGNYAFQRTYTRGSVTAPDFVPPPLNTGKYAGLAFLYVFNGVLDSAWHAYACRFSRKQIIGSWSNEPRKLAYLTGFYKGLQSAGSAIIFRIDVEKTSFMTELASTSGLLAGSLIILLPVLLLRIREHTMEKVVDETGDVVAEKV
ncbi:MAG: hypothetical protein CYPHOPRED_000904 [Cyphobasidiales sp. Tagirdzhanova-0007]|nr:MAG: hypothetical protein CYPHOPRED_000904 [Cyphobasidiales sp. Tagirdzhanova-0007]